MARSWLVRLGKFGEQEAHALEAGELITGWTLASIADARGRDEITEILATAYPDQKHTTLQNWAGQLNQFAHGIVEGDIVVVPLKTTSQLAIGRVQGQYVHKGDGRPTRRIKWARTDLPRSAIKQDLLYSLGAVQTICEISRNDAARRLAQAAETGIDPGPNAAGTTLAAAQPSTPESVDAADVPVDIEVSARDQIERHIAANFAGHGLTQLIAAVLEAQGYRARVSPPGADRGVDIMAGQGALGFAGPRLVVQVKSGSIVADQPTLQALIGCVQDTHAEHGLLVSWSGFTPPVRQRLNDLYFRVRLWDRQDVMNAVFSVYDKLPEEIRAELPLRRVWALVPDDAG